MEIMHTALQREATTTTRTIQAVFPDTPFPTEAPIGLGWWFRDAQSCLQYHLLGEAFDLELFFRGLTQRDVDILPPDERQAFLQHLGSAPPPALPWTTFVGTCLLSLPGVTASFSFLSPQAAAYYLPAYLLTAIPLLLAFGLAGTYVAGSRGQARPSNFVEHTIGRLMPPPEVAVWEAIGHMPPEVLDPRNRDIRGLSEAESFLRFAGQFTVPQRRAIGQWVEFTCRTDPLYTMESPDCTSQEEMDALRRCWVEPVWK